MSQKFFYVWNVTDQILAHPDKMTHGAAMQFIKDFPKRFITQGYYKTSKGIIIKPDSVILAAVDSEIIDSGEAPQDDDYSDIRNRNEPDEYNGPEDGWHWNTYRRRRDEE